MFYFPKKMYAFKFPILLLFFLDSAEARVFQHRCIYESYICKPIYLQIYFKNWPYHSCIHLSLSFSIYLYIYQGMNRHPFKRKVKLMIPYKDQSNLKRSGYFWNKNKHDTKLFCLIFTFITFCRKYHAHISEQNEE